MHVVFSNVTKRCMELHFGSPGVLTAKELAEFNGLHREMLANIPVTLAPATPPLTQVRSSLTCLDVKTYELFSCQRTDVATG